MVSLNRVAQTLGIVLVVEIMSVSLWVYHDDEPQELCNASLPPVPSSISFPAQALEERTPATVPPKNPFTVIAPKTSQDIVALTTHKVKPILYANTVPLAPLSIPEKKRAFIDMMLPSILLAKLRLKLERNKVLRLSQQLKLTADEQQWLHHKQKEYGVSTNEELYNKMAPHPTSLIIAQAIVESGWGTSKFFQQGNNVFGIWSFDRREARIVANEKRGDKRVYLKKYRTLDQSIHDYLLTLSTVPHYEDFCQKRLKTQNPFTLVEHLEKYSELGEEYITNIKNIIRKNRLLDYDRYQLDL